MKRLPENARILVVKFNAIGDVVMTTPALRDLRAAYPRAHITLLVGSWSAPVIRNNPHLDEILEFDSSILEFDQTPFFKRKWLSIARLILRLRRGRYDAAIVLHALPTVHLFVRLAGIPIRYGMLREGRSARHLTASVPEDLGPERYYAANYQDVVALAGAPLGPTQSEVHSSAEEVAQADRLLAEAGIGPGGEFLLVAPGGGRNPREDMQARRWPKERFAEVLLDLIARRPGFRVVLSGAGSDREETSYIASRLPGAVDFTSRLTLGQLFRVAQRAGAVLCNDSSVLHIGIAARRPVVAPFGPTSARQRMPDWALPYAWQSPIPCSPCYSGGGYFPGCPIGFQCMRETGSEQILPLLERALDENPAVAAS
jgi:heptosyltransferase-2